MRVLISLIIAMVWPLSVCPRNVFSADITAAKTELQNWQNQIVSIRVQSRQTAEAKTNAMFDGTNIQNSLGEMDWVWEDTGRFVDATVSYNDGQRIGKSLRIANTKQLYVCSFPFRDAVCTVASQVTIHENSLRFSGVGLYGPPLWGLWDNKTRTWLGTRISCVAAADTTASRLL